MLGKVSTDAGDGLPPGEGGRGRDPMPAAGLGPAGSFALVAGGMLGIGIFIGPPQMAQHVDSPALLLALWTAGGVAALCGALCVAELGVRIPRSGGDVVYLRQAFGSYGPPLAFATGWLQLLAIFPGSIATMAVALATFQLPLLLGDVAQGSITLGPLEVAAPVAWAFGIVVVLTAVNHLGIAPSGRVQILATLLPVLAFGAAAIGVLAFGLGSTASSPPPAPAAGGGLPLAGAAAAYLPVYFAYSGWNAALYVAGEVRRPSRTLPLALGLGTGAICVLYLLMAAAFLALLTPSELAGAGEAGTAAARALFGTPGVRVATILITCALLGSLNATVMGGARVGWAMAREGQYLPGAGRLHPRFGTPALALWLQAGWSAVLVATGRVDSLMNYTVAAMLITGVLTVLSVVPLRARSGARKGEFRIPLYPLPLLLFVASSLAVLAILAYERDGSVLVAATVFLAPLALYRLRRLRPVPEAAEKA